MPERSIPTGPPDDDPLVVGFEAAPALRVSREWVGVLLESRKQHWGWNGFWLAACLGVTVVLGVTHAEAIAYVVPILALLVAGLTGTRQPPSQAGSTAIAGGHAPVPAPVPAAAPDDG